jgi:hypothetical protein
MKNGTDQKAFSAPFSAPHFRKWLRGRDLNPRPLGYEPNELPDCSTPRNTSIDPTHAHHLINVERLHNWRDSFEPSPVSQPLDSK